MAAVSLPFPNAFSFLGAKYQLLARVFEGSFPSSSRVLVQQLRSICPGRLHQLQIGRPSRVLLP